MYHRKAPDVVHHVRHRRLCPLRHPMNRIHDGAQAQFELMDHLKVCRVLLTGSRASSRRFGFFSPTGLQPEPGLLPGIHLGRPRPAN